MKNFNLNLGGLIGAVVCGGIAAAIVLTMLDSSDGSRRGPYKMIALALVAGGSGGNYLWGYFFKKPE